MESGHSFRRMEVGRSLFVQVLDSLDACVGLLDVDGTVIELNAAALAATDLERSEVVGRPFVEMPCWRWSEQVRADFRGQLALAAGGKVQRGDVKLCLGQDRYVDFECSVKPVVDDRGRVTHLVWSGTDVTARVRHLENANAALGREVEERRRVEARVIAGEEQLRRQLEELETIYREAPVGLALFDRDLRYLKVNERLAALNGRRAEDHIGKTLGAVLPDMEHLLAPLIRQVFATGVPVQDFELRGATGAVPDVQRHRLVHYYPLSADDGSVGAVAAIIQDVTERHEAAAALRESEERFRMIAETVPGIIFVLDSDLRCTFASGRFTALTGIASEAVGAEGWLQALHPNDVAPTEAAMAAMRGGGRCSTEVRFRMADGSYRWFICRAAPLRAPHGEIRTWIVSATDIHEMKLAQEARSESEQWSRDRLAELEALYREAPVGLCLFGPDFRFLRINRRLAEINGVPVEAHIGHRIEEIVPDLAKNAVPILRRVFETGEPLQNVEIKGETARYPGTIRFWTEDFYPLKNDRGEVWAVGVIVRDVTERKHAEEQRELLLAELEHRVKNTLASVMSIAAHTLASGTEIADARNAFIGRLHALSHAHDLLAAGNWRGADLEQVVRRAIDPYAGADTGDVRGAIEGPAVFLPSRAAMTVGMIVHELATNAAKYGSLSSPEGRLDVCWVQQGSGADALVRLVWSETGGPPVTPPRRSGFGRTLIERGLKHELGGDAQLEFHPGGLTCTLSLPLHRTVVRAACDSP
jgi:PAS domain S-box-containing protein